MSAAYPPPSFNDRAVSLMERLHYRRAVNDDDRDALFQLRYEGYLRDGGIGPNATGRFSDAWDDTDNVDLIGVYLDGQLAASVRIHVSGDDGDIPASDVFGDVVRPYIERGQRLVDATRFVIASDHARTSAHMPFVTLRAVAMAAEFYEAYGLLATVRSEHAPVYRRVTGHRQLSEPRAYPRFAQAYHVHAGRDDKSRDRPLRKAPVSALDGEGTRRLIRSSDRAGGARRSKRDRRARGLTVSSIASPRAVRQLSVSGGDA